MINGIPKGGKFNKETMRRINLKKFIMIALISMLVLQTGCASAKKKKNCSECEKKKQELRKQYR